MAVDVSRIPNNNKFDPVREAILQLQTDIEDTGNTIGNGTLTIGTSGSLTGSGTFTANQSSNSTITIGIDDSDYLSLSDTGSQTISGDLIISGDLTVSGSTVTKLSEEVLIEDAVIVLNSNETQSPTQNAGIEIERGTSTNKTFLWNETSDKWTLGSETLIAGTFEGNLTGNLTGDVTGDVTGNVTGDLTGNVTGDVTGDLTGNASTASALATARNIEIDGAVTGNADFDGSGDITITTAVNHNHDSDYVNVTGDTMTGDLNFSQTGEGITWVMNTDGASIKFYNTGDSDTNSRLEFQTTDNNNEYFRWTHNPSGASVYELMRLTGNSTGGNLVVSGSATASSFVKDSGTQSEFLKADGSVTTLNVTTNATPSGSGALFYTASTGEFEYTPPDIAGFITETEVDTKLLSYLPLAGGTLTGLLTTTDVDVFGDLDVTGTITGDIEGQLTGTTRFYDLNGTVESLFGLYAWDTEFQITKRNITTDAFISVLFNIDYSTSAATFAGSVTGDSFIKDGGSSSEFLKADGSVDSNTYLTSYTETDTLDSVTDRNDTTTNSITVGGVTVNGKITLPQNTVGTTYGDGVSTVPSYMFQQTAGDNDGIRLYAESAATNDVRFIFEVVDDIETGDTWIFRNKRTYGSYVANEVVKISGAGDITANSFVKDSGTQAQFLKADGTTTTLSINTLNNTTAGSTSSLFYNTSTGVFDFTPAHLDDFLTETEIDTKLLAYLPLSGGTLTGGLTGTTANFFGSIDGTDHIFTTNGNSTYTSPHDTNVPLLAAYNNSNSSTNAHAIVSTRTGGANGGDAFISFDVEGVTGWSAGLDNSDSDKFKIANAWSDLGTNTKLTITTGGAVGIGTDSPSAKLDVRGGIVSYGTNNYFLTGASTNDHIQLQWNDAGGHGKLLTREGGTYYDNTLVLKSGKVGIGTTSPSAKLDVNGSASIAGNLGIGTTSPSQPLVVNQPNHNDDTVGYDGSTILWRLRNETVSSNPTGRFNLYSNGSSTIQLEGSPSRTTYFNAGNVGIGTTSPSQKLDVAGDIRMGTSGVGSILRINRPSDGADAGNVGFFSASANSDFGLRNGSGGGDIRLYSNDGSLRFYTGSSYTDQVFRVTNTGSMGVGTASPSKKLHVAGSSTDGLLVSGGTNGRSVFVNASTVDLRATTTSGYAMALRATTSNSSAVLGQIAGVFGTSPTAATYFYYGGTSYTNAAIYIPTNKTVGIGVTPNNATLHVSGQNLQYSGRFQHARANSGNNYDDTIFLENTNQNNGNYACVGFSTHGSDGQHHRAQIRAYYEGSIKGTLRFYMRDGSNPVERFRMRPNGDFHADGDVIAYSSTTSDARLKDDVRTIENALDKVKSMRGVEYTWNNGSRKGQRDLGVIAQEMEKVIPEIVREKEMPMMDDSGEKYKTVDYEKLTGVLIEAVKEQQKQIDELKARLDASTK